MTYAYILSSYYKGKANYVSLTIDRKKIANLVDETIDCIDEVERMKWPSKDIKFDFIWNAKDALEEILEKSDEELEKNQAGWPCEHTGFQLHVINLCKKK